MVKIILQYSVQVTYTKFKCEMRSFCFLGKTEKPKNPILPKLKSGVWSDLGLAHVPPNTPRTQNAFIFFVGSKLNNNMIHN